MYLFQNEQCFQTYESSKASGVEAIKACLQVSVCFSSLYSACLERSVCPPETILPKDPKKHHDSRLSASLRRCPGWRDGNGQSGYLIVDWLDCTSFISFRLDSALFCQCFAMVKLKHTVHSHTSVIRPTFRCSFHVFLLQTDEDPVHSYSETFVLRATNNNFFITNHIFRMAIHNVG